MYGEELKSKRGTAILVSTLIVLASLTTVIIVSPSSLRIGNVVRVAVIDSGINPDFELRGRIVAEKSFINEGNGYQTTDNSTWDSNPGGSPHGTYVAKIIIRDSPNALLLNAKVVTGDNKASLRAIVKAVKWAVIEQKCEVINLSLGGTPIRNDIVAEVIRWAFRRGVTIVAAAGNSGDRGLAGSSIESPATLLEVIAVAAVNEDGQPFGFSSRGPLRDGSIKPDVAAYGFFSSPDGFIYGTSFAAPRVAAVAAEIIAYCKQNNWKWTPGMIKALLVASASHLSAENYAVGNGLVNVDEAKVYLNKVPKNDGLPLIAAVLPEKAPFSFERWFVNTTSRIQISVFASGNATWRIELSGNAAFWAGAPYFVVINQTGSFTVFIHVIGSTPVDNLRLQVRLSTEKYRSIYLRADFSVDLPLARIAFDIAHTPWTIDSIYGQFREFYRIITELGIAVEEIRENTEYTLEKLQEFDAVVLLDPCAYETRYENDTYIQTPYKRYFVSEITVLQNYWMGGGNLFIVGLANQSIDLDAVNVLLSVFNMSFRYDMIPTINIVINGNPATEIITDIIEHPITLGVTAFDYYGCSIELSGDAYPIAQIEITAMDEHGRLFTENRTVLAGLESSMGGRMVITGSNFFIDNWGILGQYRTTQNAKLARQIILWLVGLLN